MTDPEINALAIQLLREGRCTENVLRKYKVPQSKVYAAIRHAEAEMVNEVTRLFPKPARCA